MGIKTRTRTLVAYLAANYGKRYQFFIEARAEGVDVVHIGDRLKFKNRELVVDYNTSRIYQVLKFGVRLFRDMAAVEGWLGVARKLTKRAKAKLAAALPVWVKAKTKVLKIKTQVKDLLKKAKTNKRGVTIAKLKVEAPAAKKSSNFSFNI